MSWADWDRRASSDWMGLSIMAVMSVMKGASYIGNPDVELPSAERWMTLWGWATLWIAAGLISGVSVLLRRGGAAAAGMMTAALFLWGLMYEFDFALTVVRGEQISRGWSNGAVYLCFAAILAWSFRRGEPDEEGPHLPSVTVERSDDG